MGLQNVNTFGGFDFLCWHPRLLIAALFRALDAFRIFDLVYVLTGGGPADATEVLSTLTYKTLIFCFAIRSGLRSFQRHLLYRNADRSLFRHCRDAKNKGREPVTP